MIFIVLLKTTKTNNKAGWVFFRASDTLLWSMHPAQYKGSKEKLRKNEEKKKPPHI